MEMLVAQAAPDPPPPPTPPTPADKRAKEKAKMRTEKARFKWSTGMIAELLRLRFKDKDCKMKLQLADTNLKRALAWQHVASVLSQSMGVVIRGDQVSQKYRKLKCAYQKEKRELLQTGNREREAPIDETLWEILNDAFSLGSGINGEVLMDTDLDGENCDGGDNGDEEPKSSESPTKTPAKEPPVVQLATALQSGMEAIATSLAARSASDGGIHALATILQQQHEETRHFQQLQVQLLQQLLQKDN